MVLDNGQLCHLHYGDRISYGMNLEDIASALLEKQEFTQGNLINYDDERCYSLENMLLEGLVVPDVALRAFRIYTVSVVVGIEPSAVILAGMTVVLVVCTETVVLVHHVVDLQLWRPPLPDALRFLLAHAVDAILTNVIG